MSNNADTYPPLLGVLARISAIREDLPQKAGRIADFLVEHAPDVVHMSVTEVSERCGVSEGSVVKFCQQLGARGFQQIKIAIARELVQSVEFIHEDLTKGDDLGTVTKKVFSSGLQALQDTMKALSIEELGRAISAIQKANRVEVFGIGSAAPIAEDANYRLLRIGIDSRVSVDSHQQAITAALCTAKSTVLTISHSGSTLETLESTRLAKEAGATTIVITNYGRSPIMKHADIVLNTLAKETHFRSEAMTSRIAQLAIVDTLIVGLALADYTHSVNTIKRTFEVLASKRI
ncbi:MAG TPA: MurR/RpiR family transcriptional regulator [Azospirillum sp.]|nr:MurR/RpiR family transcriptional regulator [Azospirillum sp.]